MGTMLCNRKTQILSKIIQLWRESECPVTANTAKILFILLSVNKITSQPVCYGFDVVRLGFDFHQQLSHARSPQKQARHHEAKLNCLALMLIGETYSVLYRLLKLCRILT